VARIPTKRGFGRGRLSEQVVNELEVMIFEEFPQPGSRLPKEDDLAERFGVSRIVIREAMKILEDRGVVEVCAGRGTFTLAPSIEKVKSALTRLFHDQPVPTLEDMERMLELRQALEETVAGFAAERATPEDLQAIEDALAAMLRGGAEAETIDADLRFHQAVIRAAHNQYFEMMLDPLTHVMLQQIKLTNSYEVGVELHRHILAAIQKGNAVAARQAVRRLIKDTQQHIRIALRILGGSGSESLRESPSIPS
jgi:DNA-binding FadR family transcriptional regulator